MPVETLIEDPRWAAIDLAALADRAAAATLRHLGLAPEAWEICLLACDDAKIAALNGDFRSIPRPTNVLSWPAADRAPDTPGAPPPLPQAGEDLGDIAIAYETCAAEAHTQTIPFPDHLQHLIVHAVLHLLGYDHETEADADLMENTEIKILATLGVSNPYI